MLVNTEPNLPEEDRLYIIEKLDTYGEQFGVPRREHESLNLTSRDYDGTLKGALLGYTYWKWFYIEFFWMDESIRGQGYGRHLLEQAEITAQLRGCIGVHLETHDFQAYEYYKRQGYTVVGTIKDLPPGHERYDMVKLLHYDLA